MEKKKKTISIVKNNGKVKEVNGKMYPVCAWDTKYNNRKDLGKK